METTIYRKEPGNYLKTDFYSKRSDGSFYTPFSLSIDEMTRLVLVNFEKDPDEFYNIFELQQAIDKLGKKHLLVLAYRRDGGTDVYHQPSYPFASQASVLNDVSFFLNPLESARFEVNSDNLDVFFVFEDRYGREIKVKVFENRKIKRNPFFLLAPVGVVSKRPTSLPIYSLYGMSFVKRKFSEIEIEIDKVKHKPDTFPLPIDFSFNFLTRYSTDTFNVDWNKKFHGKLLPLMPGGKSKIEDHGVVYELINNYGHYEIKDMRTTRGKHFLNINFSPPLPDLVCLKDDVIINGKFRTSTDNATGSICGVYYLKRLENELELIIRPNKGWIPNESRFILKFLFLIVKAFKDWPKTYVWNSKITLDKNSHPVMVSSWERTKSGC